MHKITHNIDNQKVTICNTDEEFIDFVKRISVENEDDLSFINIKEAIDYIKNYCSNLTYN